MYRQLERQLERLEMEREELREEARSLNVDPAEARRRLLEKAKADTERMQHVNATLAELETANREAREVRFGRRLGAAAHDRAPNCSGWLTS